MEKLDFRLVEAGYDLYANRFQVLRRIIIPLVKPGIIAGSILVFIPSLGAYVTPRVLGGGKNLMIGNLIELQFGQGRNWPLGAALSITLHGHRDGGAARLCAPGPKRGSPRMAERAFVVKRHARLHHHRGDLLRPAVCADRHAGRLLVQRRHLDRHLGRLLAALVREGGGERARCQEAAMRSLQIACSPPIIATIFATMAALATTRTRPYRGLTAVYAFINTPLMVPEIVTGHRASHLLRLDQGLRRGYTGLGYLIAAHTAFCIPFAYLPIRARLESMDSDAGDGGRRPLRHAVADLPAHHVAAAVAGHHCRADARLRRSRSTTWSSPSS